MATKNESNKGDYKGEDPEDSYLLIESMLNNLKTTINEWSKIKEGNESFIDQIKLELIAFYTIDILSTDYQRINVEDKKVISSLIGSLLLDELNNPQRLDRFYKKRREVIFKDKSIFPLIEIGVKAKYNWRFGGETIDKFLRASLIEESFTFSLVQLVQRLKEFTNYNQKKPRTSGAKKEFDNWVKGKEEKIRKHKAEGRSWKKIVFQWMQNDGVAIQQTAAYDYLSKF